MLDGQPVCNVRQDSGQEIRTSVGHGGAPTHPQGQPGKLKMGICGSSRMHAAPIAEINSIPTLASLTESKTTEHASTLAKSASSSMLVVPTGAPSPRHAHSHNVHVCRRVGCLLTRAPPACSDRRPQAGRGDHCPRDRRVELGPNHPPTLSVGPHRSISLIRATLADPPPICSWPSIVSGVKYSYL